MSILFFDPPDTRTNLLPLTYTRPISEIRVGIYKIAEKWCNYLETDYFGYQTEDYLSKKFPRIKVDLRTTWINATILPDTDLVEAIKALGTHEALVKENTLIAFNGESENAIINRKSHTGPFSAIQHPWEIFQLNGQEIRKDFEYIKSIRKSEQLLDPYTSVYGNDLFLEKGATIKASILNTENGPIYIGKDAEVQEGSIIRGPFCLGEGGSLRLGSKMRGDITVGPHCKVGGEVSNSVFFGHSNKAHDGYLGNSVIGEWCNLGAGTNNSNLKNTYDQVKMWNYHTLEFEKTELQFCGLIMGDHSKAGINTMFNTGTSAGVAANIFGGGFPRQIIPSFSWGGSRGFMTYDFNKAISTIQNVFGRRDIELSDEDIKIFEHIFKETSAVRSWEKTNK
ncbi:MAG: putative sugar nucleotidyl transferase [Bacteroidota bacterium]